MAGDRNVVVRIRAEYGQFQRDMALVASAARNAARETEEAGRRSGSAMGRLAQDATRNRAAWESTGTAISVGSLAIVAGVGLAITKYAQFEQAMSNVQAATHASATDMEALRTAAIAAGADTAYSAEEAAGAIEELAKAGVSTKDILGGGLAGALSLAAAGEMEVAAAAETAASAMTQFGLTGADIPHIADLLSAAAGKAQGSVSDMAAALNQSGLVAAGMGLSIEETTGTLASFASAGLLGSDAGTSFKTMLQRLNPTTEAASTMMADLGINAYDAQGNFVGMEAVAGQLQEGMSGLSEEARASAMNIIFGSDAVRAANVLYTQGAEGIAKWTNSVDAAGYAALTASIKQDNLLGDLEKLGGALDTVFIKGGSGANGALREIAQGAEALVDAIGRVPEPVLSTGFAIAGIVGATGLAVGGFLRLAPAALESYQNFRSLGTEGSRLPGTLGKVAKAAGGVAIALAALQIAGELFTSDATTSAEDYANALLKVVEAGDTASSSDLDSVFQDFGTAFGTENVSNVNSMAEAVGRFSNKTLGDNITSFLSPLSELLGLPNAPIEALQESFSALGNEMGDLVSNGGAEAAAKSFNLLTDEFKKNGQGAKEALEALPGYRDALLEMGNAAGVSLNETELLQLATGKIPARLQQAQDAAMRAEAAYGTYADATGNTVPVTEDMAKALEEVGLSADGTIVSLEKFIGLLQQTGLLTLSARDASRGFQEAIDGIAPGIEKLVADYGGLGEVLNETGTDFNDFTAAGRDAGALFDGLASSGASYTQSLADAGATQGELTASLTDTYDSLITAAGQFNITGDAADTLARNVMGIPKEANIESYMDDLASGKVAELTGAVKAIPNPQLSTEEVSAKLSALAAQISATPDKTITITEPMSPAIMEALRQLGYTVTTLPNGNIQVSETGAAATGATIDGVARQQRIATISAQADTWGAESALAWAARSRVAIIEARTVNTGASDQGYSSGAGTGGRGGLALGGRVPHLATGGRLPLTGPGTDRQDGILGVSMATGVPTAMVDAGEWVINGRSSDTYDRELAAINAGTFPKLPGYAGGGRITGLSANPGEENWQWQARQLSVLDGMETVVGELADWQIHEDGSGWVRTMDDTFIQIAAGAWQVTAATEKTSVALGLSTDSAHWAGETAKAAGASFEGAGFSASAAAGTFTVAGQVTQQAAAAIIAATAKVNTAGQQRAAASGGGLTAQAGESNAVWGGRQDQFEQAISQKYGGIKYSSLHEDGSGQMQLDDGRLIQVEGGRWQFVSKLKYGWGPLGPKLSKYAGGGRLPTSGPGTNRKDGFLGISSMTGDPSFYADGGEWIINGRSSAKHDSLLSDVNRDAPWLAGLQRYANGGRSMAHGYAPASAAHGGGNMTATVDASAIATAVGTAMSGWRPMVDINGAKFYGVMKRTTTEYGR